MYDFLRQKHAEIAREERQRVNAIMDASALLALLHAVIFLLDSYSTIPSRYSTLCAEICNKQEC
jgi:hypothetical protein